MNSGCRPGSGAGPGTVGALPLTCWPSLRASIGRHRRAGSGSACERERSQRVLVSTHTQRCHPVGSILVRPRVAPIRRSPGRNMMASPLCQAVVRHPPLSNPLTSPRAGMETNSSMTMTVLDRTLAAGDAGPMSGERHERPMAGAAQGSKGPQPAAQAADQTGRPAARRDRRRRLRHRRLDADHGRRQRIPDQV